MKEPYFLESFRFTSQEIPAYKDFLLEHNIDPGKVIDYQSFQSIPSIDKKSYILHYPLNMLFPEGKIPALGHSSSGSSGVPTLWFRGKKQSKIGEKMHTDILTKIFNINKEDPTLVLVCFAMGMWVAGNYTLLACQDISRRGYQVTTFSVGMDLEAICAILKASAAYFKNIVLIGYPFYLDLIFGEIAKKNISIPEHLFIITSGDKFSEEWRINILKQLSQPIEESKRIISIYGCSDAGILGFETPMSISIRQEAVKNSRLYHEIFGNTPASVIPTLVQYNPHYIHFEEENGELILTANLDCPLIRYNIHDRGKVIAFQDMKEILLATDSITLAKQMVKSIWKLPFLVVDSKTDVSVIFEAVKIYPEQIKAALSDICVKQYVSGSFLAYTRKDASSNTRLYLDLELGPGIYSLTDEIKNSIEHCIVNHLISMNSEYRNSYMKLPQLTFPIFTFYPYGLEQFKTVTLKEDSHSGMINLAGKKSRVLI